MELKCGHGPGYTKVGLWQLYKYALHATPMQQWRNPVPWWLSFWTFVLNYPLKFSPNMNSNALGLHSGIFVIYSTTP